MLHRIKRLVVYGLSVVLLGTGILAGASELIPSEDIQEENVHYDTTAAEIGDFNIESSSHGDIFLPTRTRILYEGTSGILLSKNIAQGKKFKKGDVLCEVSAEKDTVQIEEVRLKLQRVEENYQQKLSEYDWNLDKENKRYQLLSDPYEMRKKAIEIRKAQVERERFVYEQEREVQELKEQLEELESQSQTVIVTAPFDGVVTEVTKLRIGDSIEKGASVGVLSVYSGVMIRVSNTDYSYGSKVNIQIGMKEKAEICGDIIFSSQCISNSSEKFVLIRPDYEEVMEKLKVNSIEELGNKSFNALNVVGKKTELFSVLKIPKKACITENKTNYVNIQDEKGILHKRYVKVGLGDKTNVWVLLGLSAGDQVVVGKE